MLFRKKTEMPTSGNALPGREQTMPVPAQHHVNGNPMTPPWPDDCEVALFGMGCFWGAERGFWEREGVYSTAVGYGGGLTPNPSYSEVCTGRTGHNELVQVVFRPAVTPYRDLLQLFWEGHDPTQGMRQGNDTGTQYRSGIYALNDGQLREALASRDSFQQALSAAGYGKITTEIIEEAPAFYYAEDYHQQYLAKNPGGYCGLGGTGARLP